MSRKIKILLLTLAVLAAFAAPGFCLVEITADTEWSGEVRVKDDHVVRAGATLKILPGTKVICEKGVTIGSEGKFIALGTPKARITFSMPEGKEERSGWKGIAIGGKGVKAELAFTDISFAEAITVDGASISAADTTVKKGLFGFKFTQAERSKLERVTISDMENAGVDVSLASMVEILNSKIDHGGKFGINDAQKGLIRAVGNTISDTATGINLNGEGSIVQQNQFERNEVGIALIQIGPNFVLALNKFTDNQTAIGLTQFSAPVITQNTITGSHDGIQCLQSSSPTIVHNRFTKNTRAISCFRLCEPAISKNEFFDNETAVYLHLSSYAVVNDNNFDRNKLHLELDNMSADWEFRAKNKPTRSLKARNESLVAKGRDTPRDIHEATPHAGFVDAKGNWWGEATTKEMKEKGTNANIEGLKDFFDVQTRTYEGYEGEYVQDKIDYSNFKTAPVDVKPPEPAKQTKE